ncbi:Protein-lysine methyltransferase METTL21D [Camellia lanceoleosa]|uniref:Protein-lysine methyltransferase METTL21D n=1 Tax=Camellia lanceoleosa TaxID=1840588 RepID=A0ACC0HMF2_9ERIC|nr:Protein-lysine methyltransferase METTL21D [Camellia lanceoleosa]
MRFIESPVIEPPVRDALFSIQQDNGSFYIGTTVWLYSLILRAVEMGTDCGAAGMGLHLLGLQNIILTDIAPVMPALKRNLKSSKPLYWTNSDQIKALSLPFDLVIATDTVYIKDTVAPLVSSMEALIGDTGTVLLGYQLRSPEAHHLFWEICSRVFDIQKVPHWHLHPEYAYEEADVYILRKKL